MRFRPVLGTCAVVTLGLATLGLVPASRTALLRTLGHNLVFEAPLQAADVIVVTPDSDGAGTLEAADLVKNGLSSRVAVFNDPPDDIDREFLRRGIPYEDAGARAERQLKWLGIETIERVPRTVTGTEDVARFLPEWCDQLHLTSVIVVTTLDHSRRMNRALRRGMVGRHTRVQVRGARHSSFDPERWWQNRGSLRTGIFELEKLLFDVARHPFS